MYQLFIRNFLFQFHKGTIRTSDDNLFVGLVNNFNSIKVQLEQGFFYQGNEAVRYFNSIKVQLEQKAGYEDITLNKFQFHKGTIRTL